MLINFLITKIAMIKGGYILQPRKIDDSPVIHESPVTRELWFYLLRNVNYTDGGQFSRGQGFFRLSEIAEDLHWWVGYRKMKYSKSSLTKALRRLCEGNMTETMKATRGIIVTILNYAIYQDPTRYEGNAEGSMKVTRRITKGLTIPKERKEIKEYNKKEELVSAETTPPLSIDYDGFVKYWNDKGNLPNITKLTDQRIKAINCRLKEYGKDNLRTIIDKTAQSDFLTGNNDRKWKASIDWVLKPSNFIKIMEGHYDRKINGKKRFTLENFGQ